MPLLDYHLHSRLSADGEAALADYARLARRHGYLAIASCEHLDLDPADYSYGFYDPLAHRAAVSEARELAGETFVALAAEFTYQQSREAETAEWLTRQPFDYALGSVHFLDDIGAMVSARDSAREYFEHTPEEEAYGRYFAVLEQAAGCGLFDCLGHLDICKRYGALFYGPFVFRRWEGELRRVLALCAETGTGIELNLSGWGQAPGEPYPGLETLRLARELGVERVTVGSDAHHLARFSPELARRGMRMLSEAGFERVSYWRERRPVSLPLV